jgi:hypothetical protein
MMRGDVLTLTPGGDIERRHVAGGVHDSFVGDDLVSSW